MALKHNTIMSLLYGYIISGAIIILYCIWCAPSALPTAVTAYFTIMLIAIGIKVFVLD